MDEREMRLDGNAAAGMFMELFGRDMTDVRGSCASCGAVSMTGAQHLYMSAAAPGAVLRCRACSALLMVIVRRASAYRIAMPGLAWLDAKVAR